MKALVGVAGLALLAASCAAPAAACTTFCFQDDGHWIFGRSLDWQIEHGLIVINKRGVAKTADAERNPVRWTSRYGSLSFNQYGREYPMGGMNDAGLVIENMWLEGTEYPLPDTRPALSELMWVQYQLDMSASVDEVIASDERIRISVQHPTPLHFLVCDQGGDCATIEFLGGRMAVHRGEDLPVTALTNNTYDYSVAFFDATAGADSSQEFRAADNSLQRFCWAARGVARYRPAADDSAVEYAFGILEEVAVDRTQWRIVYDVGQKRAYYRTKSEPTVRFVDLERFDLDCSSPPQILDLSRPGDGDLSTAFSDYTYDANFALIKKSFNGTSFLRHLPDEVLRVYAKAPDGMDCAE